MTILIAHRGLAVDAVENSLDAMDDAFDYTAVVEVDVRCTHDSVAVLCHDSSLDRTYGQAIQVANVDAHTLQRAAPDIATLDDALDLAAQRRGALMLDVKDVSIHALAAIEAAVARSRMTWCDPDDVRHGDGPPPGTCSFQSSRPEVVQEFGARVGAGAIELVAGRASIRRLALWAPLIATYAHGVTLPEAVASRRVLRSLRLLRLGTYVYTVDDPHRIDELVGARASGVYTDVIDIVAADEDE